MGLRVVDNSLVQPSTAAINEVVERDYSQNNIQQQISYYYLNQIKFGI